MRTGSGARLDVKATGDGGYWRYLAREQVDATDRNKRPGMDGAPGSGTRIPEHRNEQPPRSQGSPGRGRPQPSSRNPRAPQAPQAARSEEHTSELQSLIRISYAVFCLKKNNEQKKQTEKYQKM